jgi:hypothetical protein
MDVSQLIAALQKVSQLAGDVPVVLKHAESEAETVLQSIGVHINPTTGETSGEAVLEHGDAPDTPPAPDPTPAEPAA